jgi:hypothetical protein
MLIIVQLPLTDLRALLLAQALRTPKPNWSEPNPSHFIRRFGSIRIPRAPNDRARELERLSHADRHVVEAKRIRINCATHIASINHLYSRVHADQFVTTRIEFGFLAKIDDREKLRDYCFVKEILEEIGKFQVQFDWHGPVAAEGADRFEDFGSIDSCLSHFRRKYTHYTTKHRDSSGNLSEKWRDNMTFVKPEPLSYIVVFPASYNIRWLRNKSQHLSHIGNVDISSSLRTESGASLDQNFFVGNYKAKQIEQVRLVRYHLLDSISEMRSLHTALKELDDGLLSSFEEVDIQRVNLYLNRQVDRLSDLAKTIIEAVGYHYKIFRHQSTKEKLDDEVNYVSKKLEQFALTPTYSKSSFSAVQALDRRLMLLSKADTMPSALKTPPILVVGGNLTLVEGDVGDKTQIGTNYGIAGPVQAASINFNQTWNELARAVDVTSLVPELSKIVEVARQRASTPEQFDELSAVSKAISEGNKGNNTGLIERLTKAGKWTLDIAKEIGVSVAAEAIKKALGG